MLEKLAKNNKKWLKMAYGICNDYDLAGDLVHDMYLKVYDINQKNPEMEIRHVYIWAVMLNIMKDNYNHNQKYTKVSLDHAVNLSVKENAIEFDDDDMMYLNRIKDFRYLYRKLLEENYDKSVREIAKDLGVSSFPVHSSLMRARKLVLRDRYEDLYNNKRLKYKK